MTSPLSFKPPQELRNKIEDLAKSEFGNVNKFLIHMAEKYFKIEKRYAPREDACTFQYYLGEDEAPPKKEKGWYCTKKAPKVELLGSGTIEAADKICEGCTSRINLEERWKEIKAKPFEEHTYCIEGGAIDYNTKRIQCRATDIHGKRLWHDMEKCFTYNKGRRCPSLKTLPAKPIKKTGITRRRRQ